MNVLSLFDGMSCGRLALDRCGIKYDNYFASEIDKYAIKVTQKNYPDTIQLGDITLLKGDTLPKIDLLIGGSPCQGFSFAGKQLNFQDPRSKLFFEYVRLLRETNPKYFLLENVKMKKEYQDVISEQLGVKPIEIDSKLVSAQTRKRLYWTNIPGVTVPEDRKIFLRDILLDENDPLFELKVPSQKRIEYIQVRIDRKQFITRWTTKNSEKAGCLLARSWKDMKEFILKDGDSYRIMCPVELERLQTVPDNYTNCVSETQRLKMLGNGWTVDVISHILSFIKTNGTI
jgi:DNA (cytosine-5)-methyltransferase 3A